MNRLIYVLLILSCCFFIPSGYALEQESSDYAKIHFSSIDNQTSFEQLPLSTTIETEVNSIIARTTISQTFLNNTSDWLEGLYQFPLPEDAAVDSLNMIIGQRVILGEIQEKKQAERTYQKAKANGQKASLVRQERPNIFTTKLANIAPGESIQIKIEFQHLVKVSGTDFSLRMPLGITPRYKAQSNLAPDPAVSSLQASDYSASNKPSRATKLDTFLNLNLTQFNQGQQPNRPVSFSVKLKAGFDVINLKSLNHKITTQQFNQDYQIHLAEPSQAEQDFVLNWQPQLGQKPTSVLFNQHTKDYNYHLLMMLPPTHDLLQEEVQAREMIFVVDSSGSMSGTSMEQAKAGLHFALEQLNADDSFNIIDFDSESRLLFPQAVTVSPETINQASLFIEQLEAEGGTEIVGAVELALSKPSSEKLRQVIFLTDGSIGNEAQIFSVIHNKLGNNRLFTIGIGSAPNSYFMSKAAEFGRGSYTYISNINQVEGQLKLLFSKLRYPILRDIKLQGGNISAIDLQPKTIPDLYLGEPLFISYRIPMAISHPMSVHGKTSNYQWSFDLPMVVNGADKGIAKYWARMHIDSLSNELIRSNNTEKSESIRGQILNTALSHHLVSQFTSLVAVDKTPARISEQLKQLQLENRLPAGFSAPKKHGHPQGGTLSNLMLLLGFMSLIMAFAKLLFIRNAYPNK